MYLGIDTSNYTTSVALYDGEQVTQCKQLLTVKAGERGLRQSNAVFGHIVNLPKLIETLYEKVQTQPLRAVGVSNQPCAAEGSYMPCFLVGQTMGVCISTTNEIPLYQTSHQIGHILASLYSSNQLGLIDQNFIAFHVSGGTTQALLVTPDEKELISATVIAQSSDLKAGQAIDRVGVMLGMQFPAGQELDLLSQKSKKEYSIKTSMQGIDCSLSGIENKCRRMFEAGDLPEDVAKFCILSVYYALDRMTSLLCAQYGALPLVFAGGVTSNSLIRQRLGTSYHSCFAQSEFSCDNAAGVAIQAYLKDHR